MNRTIVCKECDNNKVIIDKVEQHLYIKCSKCGNTIMQTVHLESWNKNVANTYKFRISIEDDRLFEADIIETDDNKIELQTLSKEETKIRLMYLKEYEYIRQLEEEEYREISNLSKQFKYASI
ncbi:hypothetical protein [Clostridium sp. CF012]|uniref:hypothetical protein n=1 Tax=Clostridium sp. CF012 TaxID=2843319 RepID=UPI001C0B6D3E|nr:hypothetical protein [Clostridium sp. CF012]MBU3142015.1 hypothetical protein [Clostridium sp. CF012]